MGKNHKQILSEVAHEMKSLYREKEKQLKVVDGIPNNLADFEKYKKLTRAKIIKNFYDGMAEIENTP